MPRAFRNIVVAVDFSPGSQAALAALERLRGRRTPLRVDLVHAVDPTALSVEVPAPLWSNMLTQLEAAGRRGLERLVARLRARLGAGSRVRTHLVHGTPADAVCRLAARRRADLIVLGTHGRTGLAHVVLGSVAERIVRHAGRPVLTVPIKPRRR